MKEVLELRHGMRQRASSRDGRDFDLPVAIGVREHENVNMPRADHH